MARRACDLVMKGGVTSGVVYPAAICEIARTFDLKSIGGTSAGAIAAALAAAAQYCRVRAQSDPSVDGEAGYERLRDLPAYLGRENHLFKLFAPNRATKPLFNIIVDLFAPKRGVATKITSLIRAYPLHSLAGLIPGVAYGILIANMRDPVTRPVHCVFALLVAIAGAIAGSSIGLATDLLRDLPKNCFGLVTGVDDGNPENDMALCTWLTREIEITAGLQPGKIPLTFGMLWDPHGAAGPRGLDDPAPVDKRSVNLQMITTSLSEGRPYQFPIRTNRFYFQPDEMRRFFPEHVVEWMTEHARKDAAAYPGLTPLPCISDLPIIVATRMSLSFPILLSAVPLHAIDYTDADPQQPQHAWFSDGGLTSNFPISMFDSPLPRWPTLAFNLGSFGPRTPANGVVLTQSAAQGRLSRFSKLSGLPSFLGAIFNALQNWNDNMQSTIPGVRDRIATIAMKPEEGGLNLDMDAQMIEALRVRGVEAARALVERFSEPSELKPDTKKLSWEGHRWTRFRVVMSCLQNYLGRFADGVQTPEPPDVKYDDLIRSDGERTIPCELYPLSGRDAARQSVVDNVAALARLGDDLENSACISIDAPRPAPELVQRPELNK